MSAGLVAELRDLVGAAGIVTDTATIAPYLTDWRGAFTGQTLAVVRPSTTLEVASVVKACARERIPIVPQGGNTSLAAAATPVGLPESIVLNLSRMRAIREIDVQGNTMTVEAGCVLADVQEEAAASNRFFPLSLAAEGSAQIGGLIATNAGGTSVLRYGSMRSLVLGLEVVSADGEVVDGLRALRKDNAGYDWKQLFIGSEGTLGIITAAVLRTFAPQRSKLTALCTAASLVDAMRVFREAQENFGELLVAAELFPDLAVALRTEQSPSLVFPLRRAPWYLLVEASSSLGGLEEALQTALLGVADAGTAQDYAIAQSEAQRSALWEWRETITESERRAGPSAKHDVSVPLSAIPSFVTEAEEAVRRAFTGTTVLPFGHAGDGNIHFNVILPPDGSVPSEDVNRLVHEIVARYRGSITAEHGIGRYRRDELKAHRSDAEMDVMRAVKRALDPREVMNPGAVL